MVLKRKDNGNWTLRERSQHNSNRHLVEIFSDDPKNEPVSGLQPNGHAGSYAPGEDGREANQGLRYKFRNGFGGDYEPDENEVEDLSKVRGVFWYPPASLSFYLFSECFYLPIYMSIYLSFNLYIHLSVWLAIYLPTYLFICVSVD